LLLLKFFIVFTCIFFWIRLFYHWIMDTQARREKYRVGPREHS